MSNRRDKVLLRNAIHQGIRFCEYQHLICHMLLQKRLKHLHLPLTSSQEPSYSLTCKQGLTCLAIRCRKTHEFFEPISSVSSGKLPFAYEMDVHRMICLVSSSLLLGQGNADALGSVACQLLSKQVLNLLTIDKWSTYQIINSPSPG